MLSKISRVKSAVKQAPKSKSGEGKDLKRPQIKEKVNRISVERYLHKKEMKSQTGRPLSAGTHRISLPQAPRKVLPFRKLRESMD